MSARARCARRLSSLLSTDTSGHYIRVQYDRPTGRYCVHWTGGPTTARMRELAARHADEVPLLDLDDLDWDRK
ncbi:hypothetical protein JOF56_011596 [Kibdelosporangium banguiense]|uniref:DUF1508 domain-containing protein n=1 Tax=Kibdelosporangium banguiense TaxID=1365924 RepID=A0ABS4U4T6_9PSEU|nr:hypothetical protein [Kibdelosporangium banguiense]MBP2331211.1 hypothetical protein [Kibdelosporangium banguiense]